VKNLRTSYGPLSYSLEKRGARTVLQVAGGLHIPPRGGIVFNWQGTERRVDTVPATIVINE